jgi:Xaa-Pro aminopeptidase
VNATTETHPGLARIARVRAELDRLGVDLLMVEKPVDVRYLTGFSGSRAIVLVPSAAASDRLPTRFLTDFRYRTQSASELPEGIEREVVDGELIDALGALLDGQGRLGFDEAQLSFRSHRRLAEVLPEGWRPVPCSEVLEQLRAVKDAGEIELIRAASQLADEALRETLEGGIVGRSERDVAIELELRMRRLGAECASFPSIVAAGAHGALPHAQPRDEPIPRDSFVTIDWGAVYEGYCSDCTRTYATGEGVSAQAREVYELVLRAQQTAVAAVHAGPNGRELDAVARRVIEQGGHGEHFGHGLGHGVGLEIHEGPRLSRTADERPLRAGNVVTVEPGVYLPGVLGVRIEDLVVVGEDSQEVLTSLPKDLSVIS